jgi:hypothetical protein
MRFAGTIKQYSSRAMDQLTTMAIQRGELRYFRWPYQAKVINMFEIVNRAIVLMFESRRL